MRADAGMMLFTRSVRANLSCARVGEGRPHGHRELAHAVDFGFESITRHGRAHAGRSAGEDHVTGCKRHLLRELGDDFRHAPDQLLEVPVLTHAAVDGKPDTPLARMTN